MSKNDGPAASSFLASSKTGWLIKHGGSGIKGNWKRRWFVLDHHYLFYYETAKDKHPKGIICLPDYKDCRRAEKQECQKKHSFILIPDPDLVEPGTIPRTYYIHGESEGECNGWVDAILEEMRPTVGIQKHKERARSLPHNSKTKITSSLKVNNKDLDAVTTAAATGGPQLTHLTKERAQAPKRRPPRKFKPMDEDDDPAMISPIRTLEESQLQPSPSKKPAIENVNDKSIASHTTSPVKNSSGDSPRISVKKPVLPPSTSKQKLDIAAGINKELGSPSLNTKGAPPTPPPKVYKELEQSGTGETKDPTSPPLKESKNGTMDTTDGGALVSPPATSTSAAPSAKPKPPREEETKSVEVANNISPCSLPATPTGNAPSTKPKPSKENKAADAIKNDLPNSPPATPTSNKPKPILNESTKESAGTVDTVKLPSEHPLTKPKPSSTKESAESSDATAVAASSEHPSTKPKPSSTKESAEPSDATATAVAASSEHPSTKPKPSSTKESAESSDATATAVAASSEHPSTKPKPSSTKESAESSDATATAVATTVKSPDTIENSVPTSSAVSATAHRPFAKPKPPAKHPRPKSTPSKDRNLGLPIEETKDKVSTENVTAEKTERNVKPTGTFSEQDKAEEMKKTIECVETSTEDPAMKEPIEKVTTKDKPAREEKERMTGETVTGPDKVNVERLVRPKPKPRASKADVFKSPSPNPVTSVTKESAAGGNDNTNVERKADARTAMETESSVSAAATVKTEGTVSDKIGDIDKGKAMNDIVVPNEHKIATVEDNDALYSVVELNRNSEERETSHHEGSREATPKSHDYDFVAITPRSLSQSPEQEDPGYDVVGVVKKEPLSTKESIYDNWKLQKLPQTSSSKAEDATDDGAGYASIEHGEENHLVVTDTLPVPVSGVTSTTPQYARVRKNTNTKDTKGTLHIDSGTVDDNDLDALFKRLGSSTDAHLDEAKEMLRLAQVARLEAERLKKEAAEDREAARRERIEAEELKKNAAELFKMAEEKIAAVS